MALTNTSLSAACTATDLTINVTSTSSFAVGRPIKIEQEFMGPITAIAGTAVSLLRRGIDGTAAVAHNALAPLSTGLYSDMPPVTPGTFVAVPPMNDGFVSYSVSGAITLPDKNTVVDITKATAAAMTLADPTVTQNGIVLTVVAQTAAAHTVSNSAGSGFNGSGASFDIATFGGGIGDALQVVANNGKWITLVTKNVTLG
jgi:hypothetical protein